MPSIYLCEALLIDIALYLFRFSHLNFPELKKKKNPGSPNYIKPNLLPNKLNAKGQCTNVYAHKAKFHLQLHHCKNLPMYATAKDCKLWRRPHSPLRTFQTDLPLSETACKGNKETLFSAVANRVQIKSLRKTAPDISGLSKL